MCADYTKLLLKISAVLFPALAFCDFSGSNCTSPVKGSCVQGMEFVSSSSPNEPGASPASQWPGDTVVGFGCLGKFRLLVHLEFQRIFRKTLSLGIREEGWGRGVVPTPAPCSSHPWFYSIQHHSWAVTQSLSWWSIFYTTPATLSSVWV